MSNFLSPVNFQLVIEKTPNLCSTVQQITIPGTNLGNAAQQSPFVQLNNPGNISYGTLNVSFKAQETMENYIEMQNWMEELGKPDNFEQYKRDPQDARVILLNSSRNSVMSVHFTNIQPVYLSDVLLDSTMTDIEYVTLNTSFKFDRYFFNKS